MKLSRAHGLRSIVALALLAGAGWTHAQTAQETTARETAVEQPTVAAIRLVKEEGGVLSQSPSGIAVETGKPLDPGKVAESLRALYRTGNYADVRAEKTPISGGVRLDFIVRENLFFNQVRIEGLTAPPSEASAAAAMQLTLGQPAGTFAQESAAMQLTLGQAYRQVEVDEALERLRDGS